MDIVNYFPSLRFRPPWQAFIWDRSPFSNPLIEWYWEIEIWSWEDTLYSRLIAEKMFCIKILLILPKFHEKTLSPSGDIKTFWRYQNFLSREEDVHVHSPPFIDEVLSEERQLIKWVGTFWVGIFRGEFSRGKFDGWEFFGWEFSRRKFS